MTCAGGPDNRREGEIGDMFGPKIEGIAGASGGMSALFGELGVGDLGGVLTEVEKRFEGAGCSPGKFDSISSDATRFGSGGEIGEG